MSTLLRHHESLSQLHKYVGYNNDYAMAMIIDQANAAAKSNGRFLNKTNRFAENESANRLKARIRMLYYRRR